ncbi:TMV resistance protein N-like [Cynara cardunculus var. scolymus]|uniref:TMV resistance protein N-like n=1 Tax=Cynara cardunculus var. scolymus TaxID=59895 RepID=UPI000D62FE29|nr:TMV resistance protein N-like [Cynara cardunculus var. scolymus]
MASSSSAQSWNHDVFLSFRGTDTRKTFVDHLYSALVQQGIYTYKDDETLARGEAIGPSLLKAIEESRIAVIVFSENYADSSWCLDELVYIMKCKDERGQIVMPIFYHLDPSEVRKQKVKYGEALAKHELENKNVVSWRKALTDVGNLSGWETKHVANGHEAKCIKEIVDTISDRLCVAISSDNEDLIGIEARLQDLKSKLDMESDGVVMVGIWGLGGGGKTTLASALYDEISGKFDGSCFVKDVREETRKHGLPKLQKEILSLVLKLEIEKAVGDVGSLVKSRFRRKKVLIVLDDVDHLDQLKALAGSHDRFGEGSRIIITTRDSHLLNAHKVNVIYNISLLNDDEAYNLFCKHALGHGRRIEDYEMLSKDVVSYAGGLPLALKVLGSFLCDKDISEWMSALARLKDVPDTDIVEKLKISYDGLKPMEKELFLDIACFFRGEDKDKAMLVLDACGFHPIIGVKVLIQKALITVAPGIISSIEVFEMHDLLQEMGHYIVQGENPKNPEEHSRVWQREAVLNICHMDATMRNNRIAALQIGWHQDKLPPILPELVANMKKLRWISWDGYAATSLPRAFQPKKLCYLKLEYSLVEQLWEGYKHLPNLKVIDIIDSDLVRTPDFDGLPCLERFKLSMCPSLKEIHPSIGYHERLVFLHIDECPSLTIFPPIIRMKNLEALWLWDCTQLQKFPDIQMNMDKLVKLNLRGSGIESLPSSIGKYCTNLVSLNLIECRCLQSIESNFRLLKHLKELRLKGCDQLNNMPAEGLFDVECRLQLLSLSDIPFKILHQGVVSMKLLGFPSSLRRLDLSDCNLVDGDIFSIFHEELSNLQALDLSRNGFSRLHSSLSQLPRLKFLNLTWCRNLVELPDLPSSISIIVAEGCDSLDIVGDFPTNLKWLWKVSLSVSNMLGDNGNRILQSMLQGNAVEDYFISLCFYRNCTYNIPIRGFERATFMLELPWNWYNECSGFLIYANWRFLEGSVITMKDVMGGEDEDDVLEVSYEEDERSKMGYSICYIPLGSLRNTSWWNSTRTTISFSFHGYVKVELVPRRSQRDDLVERAKDTTNSVEFWDEEHRENKTFNIIHDSKSSIKIRWFLGAFTDLFYTI